MDFIPSRYSADKLVLQAEKSFDTFSQQTREDPDYPAIHLAPPVGRLNDPNGLVYQDGIYHAFYQYSPVHPTRAVFWRHATSRDLTYWQDDKTAIAPVQWYDQNGCYSGSGLVGDKGELEFFYTGNVKNDRGERQTYQCLFTSDDGGKSFKRSADNPLISGPAPGYTAHYRDPHVFERQGRWWAVLGAQRQNMTGAVVYYTSQDRRNWDFAGEIEFSDPSLSSFAYMFECPLLFSLEDQGSGQLLDVLMFCPQGLDAQGEKFNNIYQCGYIVGRLEGNYFEVITPFTEFDSGFEFYAPQVFSGLADHQRQAVLLAWMGNAEQDDQPSWEHHWVHMLTYPRSLSLYEGKLYQRPVPQLEQLLPTFPTQLGPAGQLLAYRSAATFRLKAVLDLAATPINLNIFDSKGLAVVLTVDRDLMIMDRVGTRYTTGGSLRRANVNHQLEHSLDLLFDASALEVFFDDGAVAFTGRTYFHGGIKSITFTSADGLPAPEKVKHIQFGQLEN